MAKRNIKWHKWPEEKPDVPEDEVHYILCTIEGSKGNQYPIILNWLDGGWQIDDHVTSCALASEEEPEECFEAIRFWAYLDAPLNQEENNMAKHDKYELVGHNILVGLSIKHHGVVDQFDCVENAKAAKKAAKQGKLPSDCPGFIQWWESRQWGDAVDMEVLREQGELEPDDDMRKIAVLVQEDALSDRVARIYHHVEKLPGNKPDLKLVETETA